MKLYLHIGTEKTGSSYLQTNWANNRDILGQHGFHYPKAGKREADMLKGRISPGNGRELGISLMKGDFKGSHNILVHWQQETKAIKANKLLISNENLVEAFSDKVSMERFVQKAKTLGFESIEMLLVLRDPVDQAISLYKHRAKNGTAPILEEWIDVAYTLPNYLKAFLELAENQSDFDLKVMKYDTNGEILGDRVFKDWLGLSGLKVNAKQRVNPSLTLSELELLRQVNAENPDWTGLLYASLLDLPKDKKSDDLYLKNYYQQLTEAKLTAYSELWEKCNQWLPDDQGLSISKSKIDYSIQEYTLSFSRDQLHVITGFIANVQSFSFKIEVLKKNAKKAMRLFLKR